LPHECGALSRRHRIEVLCLVDRRFSHGSRVPVGCGTRSTAAAHESLVAVDLPPRNQVPDEARASRRPKTSSLN